MARGALFTSDVRLWLQLVSTPIVGSLCKLLPAFRSRMLGNPRFLMVLGIEEAIGVAAKWSAEKSSRKDNFWKVQSQRPPPPHLYPKIMVNQTLTVTLSAISSASFPCNS